ncbi:hypothetical protein G7Y89_g1897 [Cudoniella acicularis]|uniref:Uncharacterized protein n=1 Tax=Cudoniella acicularis TaxID=354080 RepID=A0A8H4W948_9HELO|nr:hypothetical protein G7Y89_g1897 [Cudoniella acicularis]
MEEDEKQRLADLKPDVDQHVLITELKTKILVLETALEASVATQYPENTDQVDKSENVLSEGKVPRAAI